MSRINPILSLDPSSTVVGYAAMTARGRLMEAGLIAPECKRDASYARICAMRLDLRGLLDRLKPTIILIEWTKGKVGRRRHAGRGAGLAVYGAGVGAIATECEIWAERCTPSPQVVPILENDWTRGVRKEDRTLAIKQLYPQYRHADDPGGDVADALGLARWYLRQDSIDGGYLE